MPKVNRNDPCPCGSGKKHKNCCMRKDQAIASRQTALSEVQAFAVDKLYQYAQSPRFSGDLVNAFNFFWGGVYDYSSDSPILDEVDVRRTFEWFAHDYHTSTDRRRVIDLLLETQTTGYPPEAIEVLRAWASSVTGMFRVLQISGEELALLDCLRQEELSVLDAAFARSAQRGDLLIGRLYDLYGSKRLSLMAMALPGVYQQDLTAYVTNAYKLYHDEHYHATWDEFLRENGHIFNAYLLSPRADSQRSRLGPGTRFHDPAISRDRLAAFSARQARQRERQQVAQEQRQPLPGYRSSSGIILPDSAAPPEPERPAPSKEDQAPPAPTILIPGRDF